MPQAFLFNRVCHRAFWAVTSSARTHRSASTALPLPGEWAPLWLLLHTVLPSSLLFPITAAHRPGGLFRPQPVHRVAEVACDQIASPRNVHRRPAAQPGRRAVLVGVCAQRDAYEHLSASAGTAPCLQLAKTHGTLRGLGPLPRSQAASRNNQGVRQTAELSVAQPSLGAGLRNTTPVHTAQEAHDIQKPTGSTSEALCARAPWVSRRGFWPSMSMAHRSPYGWNWCGTAISSAE